MPPSTREQIKQLKEGYGKPSEGFEEFLASCELIQPYLTPTSEPEFCKGYKLPSGLKLHDIMIQPYYDSRQMVARPSDVIVASFPKTGTTWTQEICYLIMNGIDVEKANSKHLEDRIPFIEIPSIGIRGIEALPNPRIIKTHLPYDEIPSSFLKNKTKIVYIARNPKDTAVSYYHFIKLLGYCAYTGTLEKFLDMFVDEDFNIMYSPYTKHIIDFWNRRNDGHVLFLTYEGLQKDFKGEIRKIANFLGKPITDEQVDKIAAHCNFDSMSKNPMTNYSRSGAVIKVDTVDYGFMRKGKVGDWKNHFTPEMSRKVDEYVERTLRGTGFEFEYNI